MKFSKWLKKEGWIPFASYVKGVLWVNGETRRFTRHLYQEFLSREKKSKSPTEDWQLLEAEIEKTMK